jgi:hypothetical protein
MFHITAHRNRCELFFEILPKLKPLLSLDPKYPSPAMHPNQKKEMNHKRCVKSSRMLSRVKRKIALPGSSPSPPFRSPTPIDAGQKEKRRGRWAARVEMQMVSLYPTPWNATGAPFFDVCVNL